LPLRGGVLGALQGSFDLLLDSRVADPRFGFHRLAGFEFLVDLKEC
jgi:hypothetical protein